MCLMAVVLSHQLFHVGHSQVCGVVESHSVCIAAPRRSVVCVSPATFPFPPSLGLYAVLCPPPPLRGGGPGSRTKKWAANHGNWPTPLHPLHLTPPRSTRPFPLLNPQHPLRRPTPTTGWSRPLLRNNGQHKRHNPHPCAPCVAKGTQHTQLRHEGKGRGLVWRPPKEGLSTGAWRRKVVMSPHRGNDPASGHPRAHQPPLGRGTSPPAWDGRLDPPGQRRRHLPSSVWTRRREVKQGKSGGSVGTTDQGNGKGRSGERPMGTTVCGGKGQEKGKGRGEGRLGQGGRGRAQDGERPMGTTACGGKGSKGRAANGNRPVGAASCRREQHTMASCPPPPLGSSLPGAYSTKHTLPRALMPNNSGASRCATSPPPPRHTRAHTHRHGGISRLQAPPRGSGAVKSPVGLVTGHPCTAAQSSPAGKVP